MPQRFVQHIKKPWKSKTIIVFILYLIWKVAGPLFLDGFVPTPEQAKIEAAVISGAGIALRVVTKEPVGIRAE